MLLNRYALLATLLLCTGCKLVDQTTFNPGAGKLQVGLPPPAAAGTPALITIDFAHPDPAYDIPLRQAVDQAVARKPNVAFDVTTVVPATGSPADQVAAAATLSADARAVARTINDQGVDEDRITLSARSQPGAASRQIQVFVH